MLAVLVSLLGGLVLAVIVLGATPLWCEFRLTLDRDVRFKVLLRFLGGRTPALTISDTGRPKKVRAKPKKKRAKTRKSPGSRERRGAFTLSAFTNAVQGVANAIHVEGVSLRARFGTGDPAETGQLYGAMTPIAYGLAPTCRKTDINLTPVFDAACLEGQISGHVRVTPFALVPPLARFGWEMFMR